MKYILMFVLSVNFCFSQQEQNLYFCTTDLEMFGKYDERNSNFLSDYIEVPLKLDDKSNSTLRHCFVLVGYEKKQNLYVTSTLGFGNSEEDFNQGSYGQEELSGKTISCTKVKEYKKDLHTKNQDWNEILNFFHESASKGYNLTDRNCCNVAFNALSKINDVDTSNINQNIYHINYGIGLVFHFNTTGKLIGHSKNIKNKGYQSSKSEQTQTEDL